jgi:transcriptional regulator with XRE-family HTH domain
MTASQRRSFCQPSDDDHQIYEWVKMQGKTQSEVAGMFGIDQSTVSRIIQRYERWQAHAKDRENGRLDRSERLRAQRWLTYERNELILASCLRIAHEMEGFTELSKSTIHRPASSPSNETEIRTQHSTIDRSGVAARFLRLANRINMEQLKLAALIEPPPAEPLSEEELAAEARQAAADAAEIADARRRAEESVARALSTADDPPEPSAEGPVPGAEPETTSGATGSAAAVHNLHNEIAPKIAATNADACTCAPQSPPEKTSSCACIADTVDRAARHRGALVSERQALPVDSRLPVSSHDWSANQLHAAAAVT